jgi:competence protein ComEC
MFLSHPSRDNIGGAQQVVRSVTPELIFQPELPFPNPFGEAALREGRSLGVRVETTEAGRTVRLGRLRVTVLWPEPGASPADDPNDHATVLLASYGKVDALLPADAESNVLERLSIPPVEILKVSHHGSADDGLPELLEVVRPRVAIVSVGAKNDYGHPRASTMAALERAPALDVFRTDQDGRVVIESDGRRISVGSER